MTAAVLALLLAPATAAVTVPPVLVENGEHAVRVVEGPKGSWAEGCVFAVEFDAAAPGSSRTFTLCAAESGPVARPLDGLGADVFALAADPAPDGGVTLLLGAEGAVRAVTLSSPDAPPVAGPIARHAGLGPVSLADRPDLDGDGTPDLVQTLATGIGTWRRDAAGFTAGAAAVLPPTATFQRDSLTVFGRRLLEASPGAKERWTGPEPLIGDRWRVFRVPLGPEGAGEACAAWIEPGAAYAVISAAVVPGATPRLAALVQPSDRIAIMNELRLVVAPLACRASGKGSPPELKVETAFPNYSQPALSVRDVTGDGVDDIVAVGVKGRMSSNPLVSVWPGAGNGAVEKRALTWETNAKDLGARGWRFDVDGDGRLDLTFVDGDELRVVRGVAPARGKVPLAEKPTIRLAVPDTFDLGAPVGVLHGHGRRYVVIVGRRKVEKKWSGVVFVLPVTM